ncbi:hypothetical protein KY363_07795, partial [Candidatus Woesearchaeota archaeon]|nr:hypothetical protein [Candidatus Woesearchaeota archaeon]
FTADFYLSMNCRPNCTADFEFMNGRASSMDKIIDEPDEKFYRVQANLNSPVDLRRFPFDSQRMEILLEDKSQTADDLVFVPLKSESGLDSSIAFTGWQIDGWEASVTNHSYDIYDETYSQYSFTIDISRIYFNSFLKTFLPIFFMLLIVMFTFIMDPDKIPTRLAVTTSTLVASVMFHISISNQIPPVGYLTVADRFMILTYFVILAAAVLNIALLELSERKKTDLVEKLHRRTEYAVFFVVPIIYVIFFLFFA